MFESGVWALTTLGAAVIAAAIRLLVYVYDNRERREAVARTQVMRRQSPCAKRQFITRTLLAGLCRRAVQRCSRGRRDLARGLRVRQGAACRNCVTAKQSLHRRTDAGREYATRARRDDASINE